MVDIFRRSCLQVANAEKLRKTRWAIIRNTYPDLKNTTVKTWKDWFGNKRFGQFVDVAPFEHRISFQLDDKTAVQSEIIFLALDREEDIKKLLSLELTGAYVNEARDVKKAILNTLDGRIGRYPRMQDGGATWHGMTLDSNMPDEDHWLYEAHNNPASGWEFYIQPGGVIEVGTEWQPNPDAENLPNLPPGYYTNQLAGKEKNHIAVLLGAKWGVLDVEGTYYAEQMLKAEEQGRVREVLPDPALPVHTFWDMGVADRMCIWFGQGTQGQWRWLDYYQNSGKNLSHYANVMADKKKERGWVYGSDVWPADGNVREMTAIAQDMKNDNAETRAKVWHDLTGRKPVVLGNHKFGDRIEQSRKLIAVSVFDKEHTAEGRQKLRRYKKKYDRVRGIYLDEQDHDENSHGASAFGTAGMGKDKIANSIPAGLDKLMDFRMPGVV